MSTLMVHVGQGGCQFGERVWRHLQHGSSDARDADARWPFLDHRREPLAVLIDSEPKALEKCRRRLSAGGRAPRVVAGASGRGNNWACGFCDGGEGSLFRRSAEALRGALEASDSLEGIALCHSTGGGTGSGLGSALLQYLREETPKTTIASVALLPFFRGDSGVYHYNSALSLQYAAEFSDLVVLNANDELLWQCQSARAGSGSMSDINEVAALNFVDLIAPRRTAPDAIAVPASLNALAADLALGGGLKFVDVKSSLSHTAGGQEQVGAADATAHCGRLLGAVLQPEDSNPRRRRHPLLAMKVQLRLAAAAGSEGRGGGRGRVGDGGGGGGGGGCEGDPYAAHEAVLRRCLSRSLVRWPPERVRWERGYRPALGSRPLPLPRGRGTGRKAAVQSSACVVTNAAPLVTPKLEGIVARAHRMLEAGAFVHWYERHGVEREDLLAAQQALADVADAYYACAGGPL